MNDVNCFGGTRPVNMAASLVRVQEHGTVWPHAKSGYLVISNVLHAILLDNIPPSKGRLEAVFSYTACRRPLSKAACHM